VRIKAKTGMALPDLVLAAFGFLSSVTRNGKLDPAEIAKAWLESEPEQPTVNAAEIAKSYLPKLKQSTAESGSKTKLCSKCGSDDVCILIWAARVSLAGGKPKLKLTPHYDADMYCAKCGCDFNSKTGVYWP
jgi:hypothetical protein